MDHVVVVYASDGGWGSEAGSSLGEHRLPDGTMSAIIHTSELSRRFGRRWAYARVTLSIEPGERVLLFGANGSGKTTLLRTLATLLRPSRGDLRLFGADPRASLLDVRRRLGFFSHNVGLYEDLSARDNLAVLARLTGRPRDRDILAAALADVGLEDRPDPIRRYSAGMRRRVGLAALLSKKPELTLLDEPFSALDPAGMAQVSDIIRTLPGTVVVTSHQVERAAALCQRAILLKDGQIRWQGPAEQAWAAWRASQREAGS
ncbi:MAG: heme exporter protein A [Myxococcota bacterium]|jgi:heme exporter protein A